MVLVFIISDYGGFNNFLAELSNLLAENRENKIHIICKNVKVIDIPDKPIDTNIQFHFIDIPRTFNIYRLLLASYKIRILIESINPDLIHSHFTTSTFPTILFRKNKYTYWATIHGVGMNSTQGFRKFLFTIVETICFRRLDRVFVLNKQDYIFLDRKYKNVTKYDCLGVGCNIDKFNINNFSNAEKEALKKKHNIKENSIILSFTGRYVKFKGFDILIKSFIELNKAYPGKFELLLMGGIDPVHKIGLEKNEITFYKTNNSVHDMGFTEDVEKYLSITDIFLFPSKKEGLPTCILEALSMGVPVVTFDSRGNNDIIQNNVNGFLITPYKELKENINEIVREVSCLSNNEILRKSFSENAINGREKYSRIFFLEEHLELYLEFKKTKVD